MSSIAVSLTVFACVFGGALCGILVSRSLPQDHLSADSKQVVTMSMGLVATMAALVLGLLVSSAKNFYGAQSAELTQMSTKVILLDRVLAHYGPETKGVRDVLRGVVSGGIDRIWPQENIQPSETRAPSTDSESLIVKIQALSPKDDQQRSLQTQALSIVIGLTQTRWLMYEQDLNLLQQIQGSRFGGADCQHLLRRISSCPKVAIAKPASFMKS